ncbi:MAG: amidohydrolase family protein [Blautia sp.]
MDVVGNRATLASDARWPAPPQTTDCLRTCVKEMGIPLETAVACAPINPAKSLGVSKDYGSIATGKKANVVLLDRDLALKAVVKDGRRIK